MNRRLLWAVLVAVLVPAAAAEDPVLPSGAADQTRRFRQDNALIETLVQGGVRLAGQDDPMKRAECCNEVAERLAAEIQQAAENRNKERVAELGQYLHALLEQGVAANLSAARKQIPAGSTRERNLHAIRDRAEKLVRPLEEQLRRDSEKENQQELQHTLRVLQGGRAEVENAVKGGDKPAEKPQP